MSKRANKITSLLVASAAIMSLVPAYASDAEKIESQDGTVYDAVAYKDGEFYIDGKINDKDEAAYYLANGKYNNLDDINAGSDVGTYGNKYVDVESGDHYVDLSSGKVTNDDIAGNARDDVSSALKKKIKADTDGRYLKDGSTYAADTEQKLTSSNELPGNKFADTWYAVKYANKNATNGLAANGNGSNTATLTVFTDGSGNYIDADYSLGKIKVTTSGNGSTKSVFIENTNDTDYETAVSGTTVSATVSASSEGVDGVIAQDSNYIYRKAVVTVKTSSSSAKISQIYGKDVSCSAFTSVTNGYQFNVIQKISKSQSSSSIDGAKYSNSVTSYIIADSDAGKETFSYSKCTAVSGNLIGYTTSTSGNISIQTANLKSEDGLYYVDLKSASTGDDAEVYNSKPAVDVDASGNVWRLKDGYLYQWNNDDDWDKVYRVDGAMKQLSVYDKDDLVAWNSDDDVYSIVGSKLSKKNDTTTTGNTTNTTTTTNTSTNTSTTVSNGWQKNSDNTWSYYKSGTKATGWLKDGSTWYYLKSDGIMATGWIQDGSNWYYLNASGAMQTGWINDNGTWYYCNGSGVMLSNTTVDGYKLGANGAWV